MHISGNATIARALSTLYRPTPATPPARPDAGGQSAGKAAPVEKRPAAPPVRPSREAPATAPADKTTQAVSTRSAVDGTDGAKVANQNGDGKLTLEGFSKAWGQTDSPYDLNGDDVVDVQDMIKFVLEWDQHHPPADDGADPVAKVQTPTEQTPTPQVTETDTTTAGETAQDQPAADPEKLTLKGLIDAWGQSDSAYDFNGDSTVDVQDLSFFVNNWPNPPDSAGGLHAAPPSLVSPERLANSLINRLIDSGFEDRPPSNIREVVDGLGLDGKTRDHVLGRLSAQYPRGLGVNVVG